MVLAYHDRKALEKEATGRWDVRAFHELTALRMEIEARHEAALARIWKGKAVRHESRTYDIAQACEQFDRGPGASNGVGRVR